MDGFEEKKWFVYLSDHHEGPFSLADIQQKLVQGQVSPSSYAWSDGLPDWRPMSEIPAFESILSSPRPPAPPVSASRSSITAPSLKATEFEEKDVSLALQDPNASSPNTSSFDQFHSTSDSQVLEPTGSLEIVPSSMSEEPMTDTASPSSLEQQEEEAPVSTSNSRTKTLLKVGVPIGLVAVLVGATLNGTFDPILKSPALRGTTQSVSDFTRPYLLPIVNKAPWLGKFISPIPSLDDITAEEYENLRATALIPTSTRLAVSLALSQTDLLMPSFYIVSNLPDGAIFDIYIEGVADTLLNNTGFSTQMSVTLKQKYAKNTNPIRLPDGKPLSRGEYVVTVVESDNQMPELKGMIASSPVATTPLSEKLPKGRKLVAKKVYFLGGQRDSTYSQRLQEYHDKLKAKATSELDELKQLYATLEKQLAETLSQFSKLKKGKTTNRNQMKQWSGFHEKWTQIDGQLNLNYQKWTPEVLSSEFFYTTLYPLVIQAGIAVSKVHGFQHGFFTGTIDAVSFDIQLGESINQAQTQLSVLKTKLELAAKLPLSTQGMPQREGL